MSNILLIHKFHIILGNSSSDTIFAKHFNIDKYFKSWFLSQGDAIQDYLLQNQITYKTILAFDFLKGQWFKTILIFDFISWS